MPKKPRKSAKSPVSETEPVQQENEPGTGAPSEEALKAVPAAEIEDPIGDVSDGDDRVLLADATETGTDRETDSIGEVSSAEEESATDESEESEESDFTPSPRPPGQLERLQKILSKAGVASRRKAEEMIEQGRVQINGKLVTELGTKADATRDHIRVDGKLLHGAERLRYFVLNKPRGFVTTVRDPEGRPTVMQFFGKMRERLYPVGRLDYMSEGLLLVTNDGDMANRLTKAGSGVEKVYLVKVAGQPSEQELDLLRGGVSIERGKPGSAQVRTSPARIRQVRQGDNPWYEVVLIEGRNRELRKMFSAVGHFVEKIRRVGYGPLVLDQEPGNMRELDAEELSKLRLAAEGELRTPKAKDVRRRNLADAQLPTLRPKPSPRRPDARPFTPKPFAARPFDKGPGGAGRSGEFRPKRSFTGDKPFSPARASGEESLPSGGRSHGSKPAGGRSFGPRPGGKPFAGKPTGRPFAGKPAGRAFAGKPASGKPAWNRTGGDDRPPFKRPAATRREPVAPPENLEEKRSFKLRIDRIEAEHPDVRSAAKARPSASRPLFERPRPGKPGYGKPRAERARFGEPRPDRARPDKPRFDKPGFDRPASSRPRFDKPGPEKSRFEKAGFNRSGSGRPDRAGSRPGADSSPRLAEKKPRWNPRPGSGASAKSGIGRSRPGTGGFSRPKPGGSSKPGFKGPAKKGKPGAKKHTGRRPGGKKRS